MKQISRPTSRLILLINYTVDFSLTQLRRLRRVLRALDKIGRDNGGTRAFGTPGYKASVDYVLERAQTRFGKEMDTYVQPFNFTYDETLEIYVHGPEGEDVFVISPQYNPPTPLPDGIEAPLINTPVNDETGSMCLPEQWEGIDATGKLALVKRGICDVSTKLKLAKAHGALGKEIAAGFTTFNRLPPYYRCHPLQPKSRHRLCYANAWRREYRTAHSRGHHTS